LGGKLVRDKIPTVAPGAYVKCDGSERLEWLKKKLVEEALEFLIEPSVEELADVLEVVKALIDGVQKKGARRLRGVLDTRYALIPRGPNASRGA